MGSKNRVRMENCEYQRKNAEIINFRNRTRKGDYDEVRKINAQKRHIGNLPCMFFSQENIH